MSTVRKSGCRLSGHLDDKEEEEVQRLVVFVHYKGELSKDEKHTIEELLKIEVPYEEISYVKSGE